MEKLQAYLNSHIEESPEKILAKAKKSCPKKLANIYVPPYIGKLLSILIKASHIKTALEIGTLAGYSSYHIASALPYDGHLTTIEKYPEYIEAAKQTLDAFPNVTYLQGEALEILPTLSGPYDLIFIDADKESLPAYVEHALRLTKSGSLIAVDNMMDKGRSLATAEAILHAKKLLFSHPNLDVTLLPTLTRGDARVDAFALARRI